MASMGRANGSGVAPLSAVPQAKCEGFRLRCEFAHGGVVQGRGSAMGSVPASGLVRAAGVVGDGSLVGAAAWSRVSTMQMAGPAWRGRGVETVESRVCMRCGNWDNAMVVC